MSLVVKNLHVTIAGKEILRGVDLEVGSGEVHAIMGPNGAGKSTLSAAMLGRPGYVVTKGTVHLDGQDLTGLSTFERAHAGLHLSPQYPTEVPGVSVQDVLTQALVARGRDTGGLTALLARESAAIDLDVRLLERSLNVDQSGGEKKRNETLQIAVLEPRYAILDELDSGLDVDALRACARRIAQMATGQSMGVLAITHYNRLLIELRPSHIHILAKGRIVASGGPELADVLERDGYGAFVGDDPDDAVAAKSPARSDDPFADPFA